MEDRSAVETSAGSELEVLMSKWVCDEVVNVHMMTPLFIQATIKMQPHEDGGSGAHLRLQDPLWSDGGHT